MQNGKMIRIQNEKFLNFRYTNRKYYVIRDPTDGKCENLVEYTFYDQSGYIRLNNYYLEVN